MGAWGIFPSPHKERKSGRERSWIGKYERGERKKKDTGKGNERIRLL